MASTDRELSLDEVSRRGREIYRDLIEPTLQPCDMGKFIAIDVLSSDYEVNEDDYTAVRSLRLRRPDGTLWLECAGQPTYAKLRSPR